MNLVKAVVNVDAFIIPNRPGTADLEYRSGIKLAQTISEIAEINGFEYDPETDKLVQMWWTDFESDNIQAHGFELTNDGDKYEFNGRRCNFLPASFFEGHVEGDTIPITIRMMPEYKIVDGEYKHLNVFSEETPTFEITFNITLNQTSYRYKRFGNFEDVLKYVCY